MHQTTESNVPQRIVLSKEDFDAHVKIVNDLWKKKNNPKHNHYFSFSLSLLSAHQQWATYEYLTKLGINLDWVESYLPDLSKTSWEVQTHPHGLFATSRDGLRVIMSGCLEPDNQRWLHVSASRNDRLPNWSEMNHVKEVFLGRETEAIIKLAPRSQWVNIMPFCLHIWSCVDRDVTPDFTHGSGGI